MQKLGKGETISVTFRVEREVWEEFLKWCKKNNAAAAAVLRLYVAKELEGSNS